jgi:hypothetical protein
MDIQSLLLLIENYEYDFIDIEIILFKLINYLLLIVKTVLVSLVPLFLQNCGTVYRLSDVPDFVFGICKWVVRLVLAPTLIDFGILILYKKYDKLVNQFLKWCGFFINFSLFYTLS